MQKIEKVHVIFKTHLDIGFTDLARNVVAQYMNQYIPKAIELAEQLAAEEGEAGFIWTTGSWLIYECLTNGTPAQQEQMEQAISKGYIAWHGLPFTTHTELLDAELFDYGLSLSRQLDARFGRQTVAAKMTDVPGHTRAIIPHMARSGIAYLHLGVNPASAVPSVPNIFRWRGSDSTEIIVNYAADYGDTLGIEGLNEIMVFAHTGDNCGPPAIESIRQQFAELAARYPGAIIEASTMDRFTQKLLAYREQLPVIEEEIGDTWIHGTASDPWKLAAYRALLRLRWQWLEQGRFDHGSREYATFSDQLLLVAEHTWGMDEKKFLSDFKHYLLEDFHAARRADIVAPDAIPDKYRYLGFFRMHGESEKLGKGGPIQTSYAVFESSWKEQRRYVASAIEALEPAKQSEALDALRELEPCAVIPGDAQPIRIGEEINLGMFEAAFAADGSICLLRDAAGKVWADEAHHLGNLTYETFGVENYHTWFEQYIQHIDKHYNWADSDFGKPGMENLRLQPVHHKHTAAVDSLVVAHTDEADTVYVRLWLPTVDAALSGAPAKCVIAYRFAKEAPRVDVALQWFDKPANRLPEALWLSFAPKVDNPNRWRLDKLGEHISPLDVVKGGNRNLHAVSSGVFYHGADGAVAIETLDAALVSPGEGRLLQHNHSFVDLGGGMHFLLYNNVWGTNFPMWYEENAKFRFSLTVCG